MQKNCVRIRKTVTAAGSIICYDKSAVPPLELPERKMQVSRNAAKQRKGMTNRGVELGTPDIDWLYFIKNTKTARENNLCLTRLS